MSSSRPGAGSDPLTPGELFDDRYAIVSLLGRGGMGAVYRARDQQAADGDDASEGDVALKVLRPERMEPVVVEGLRIEFSVLACLRHPNLVRVHRYAVSDTGMPYLVAERVDGIDLRRATQERPPADLLWHAHGILLGLDHLHRRGYVHQDIKPSNILVQGAHGPIGEQRAKIADLGLAAAVGHDPGDLIAGTVPYLSPERLVGAPADPRSDLWALGISLWACATGRLPHRPSTIREAMGNLRGKPIPPLRDMCADAPAALEEVVQRLLAPGLDDRFRDATGALEAVERAFRRMGAQPPRAGTREAVADAALVGRGEALEIARHVFSHHRGAGPRALAFIGPRGSGRSRLLREIATTAQLAGTRVLFVPQGVGLSPWRSGLQPAAAADVQTAEDVVVAYVSHLAEQEAIVVVDDIEARDAVARSILGRLASALAGLEVLHPSGLVVAMDAETPGLDALDDTELLRHVLQPLSADDLAALCQSALAGTVSEEVSEAVQRATGGNPAAVVGRLRHMLDVGALRRIGGRWQLVHEALSALESPEAMADPRLAALSPPSRELLAVAALLGPAGSRLPLPVAREVMADPGPSMAAAIDQLCAQQIARLERRGIGDAAALVLTSEQVRQAIADDVDNRRRRETHAALLEALSRAEHGAPDSILCRHALGAGQPERALELASAAMDRALAQGDALVAMSVASVGREAAAHVGAEALRDLELRYARALLILGRPGEVQDVARRLSERWPDDLEVALVQLQATILAGDPNGATRALARAREISNRPALAPAVAVELDIAEMDKAALLSEREAAFARGEAALQRMRHSPDTQEVLRLRARVHATASMVALDGLQLDRARTEAEQAEALYEQAGDEAGMAQMEYRLATISDAGGDPAALLTHIERGEALAERCGRRNVLARLTMMRGAMFTLRGRYDEAATTLMEAERQGRVSGTTRVVSAAIGNRVVVHRCQGLFGSALRTAMRSLAFKERLGDRVGRLTTLCNLSTVYLKLYDVRSAAGVLRRVLALSRQVGNRELGRLYYGWLCLLRGDIPGALQWLRRIRESFGGQTRRYGGELVIVEALALQATGDTAGALALLETASSDSLKQHRAYDHAWAQLERGMILGGQHGLSALRESAAVASRAGARGLAWRGWAGLGRLELARGDTGEGRRSLARAAEILDAVMANLPRRHVRRYVEAPAHRELVALIRSTPAPSSPARDLPAGDDGSTLLAGDAPAAATRTVTEVTVAADSADEAEAGDGGDAL